jgi:hypothetical protein
MQPEGAARLWAGWRNDRARTGLAVAHLSHACTADPVRLAVVPLLSGWPCSLACCAGASDQ